MSLLFKPNSARLSVIGNGWNNVSFDSGGGFVFDDLLWKDIALDLDYDFDMDMDFGELDLPEFDLSDIIFDLDGTIYTEMDGAWRNPLTGELYPGGGEMWMAENLWVKASNRLSSNAKAYSAYMRFVIPQSVIDEMRKTMKKVFAIEVTVKTGSPFYIFRPLVWMFRIRKHICAFLEQPFEREGRGYGTVPQYMENIKFLGHEIPPVCESDVSINFDDIISANVEGYSDSSTDGYTYNIDKIFEFIPELPEQYWANFWDTPAQMLYGSYEPYVKEKYGDFSAKDTTITTDQIKNGTSGLESREYDGKTYYKV